MKFDQSERLIKIKGPFGPEDVMAISFSANEAISRLFSFQLDFLCKTIDLTGKDIIGKNITVEIQRFDDDGKVIGSRFFNGYINRLSGGELTTTQTETYRAYHVEIVPWLWFLTQASNCHIFFPEMQEKSIQQVVEDVFNRNYHVKSDFSIEARSLSNRKVEHCVQYRETDFNFISRILEQYGVYYYFEHSDGEHKMVLCDQPSYPPCEESSVDFMRQTLLIKDNCVTSWRHQFEFVSGKFSQTDYDFEKALENLETKSSKISSNVAPDVTSYEIYDFPGEYKEKKDGEDESRVRQEEEEVSHDRVIGSSTCKTFSAGFKFKLNKHPDKKLESQELGEFLITSVQHHANQPYDQTGSHIHYANDFSCIPAEYTYRPQRITPKPIVSGIQTGVVTGPPDEEIYTDQYGRVKVFFHWDRETRKIKKSEGQNCSCWIRVAQNMAGRKWGFMAIPRIGQEVVIEFLEGDPDRPMIVGSVYNSDQMPHYDPEEHKTRTYFKTNSSKGGDGFNELMFEDLNNEEMIYMHAQKNMDTRVLNTSTETIHNNRYQIIGQGKFSWDGEEPFDGGDQSELVTRDKHLNIHKDQHEKIDGNYLMAVGYGEPDSDKPGEADFDIEKTWRIHVGDDGMHRTIDGDDNTNVGGSKSCTVKGDLMTKVDGGAHLKATGDVNMKSMTASVETDTSVDIKGGTSVAIEGGMSMHLKSGVTLTLESGVNVTLKVGGSFVSVTQTGVAISGPLLQLNSGGAAGSGSGCSPKSPASPTDADPVVQAEPMITPLSHDEKTGQKSN